jgi:hypothetical protein
MSFNDIYLGVAQISLTDKKTVLKLFATRNLLAIFMEPIFTPNPFHNTEGMVRVQLSGLLHSFLQKDTVRNGRFAFHNILGQGLA